MGTLMISKSGHCTSLVVALAAGIVDKSALNLMVAPRVADELTGTAHGSPVIGFSLGNQASSNGQLYVVQSTAYPSDHQQLPGVPQPSCLQNSPTSFVSAIGVLYHPLASHQQCFKFYF